MNRFHLAALIVATTLVLAAPISQAQNGPAPQVSVVTLKVMKNPDGSQSVITPKGDLATLPGAGVKGDVAEIYMGSQGGFWYIDKKGHSVDLNEAYESLQYRRARQQQGVQVPQYAPQPYMGGYAQPYQGSAQTYQQQPEPQQSYEQAQSQQGSSGSGVASALGTAAAAGMGAMAGAALTNGYYNAPYGTPMYYGPHGAYYYNGHERREFDDLNQNQKAVLYNKHQVNKQNQQQAIEHRQSTQQARMDSRSTNQQNRQQAFQQGQANHNSQNFQRQNQWYQDQLKQNPHQFQRAQNNPFVSQQGGRDLANRASQHDFSRASSMGSRAANAGSRAASMGSRAASMGSRAAGRARGGGGRRR